MKQIRAKSEYEKHGSDVSSVPSQYDNNDYGKRRKAKVHNYVIKNTLKRGLEGVWCRLVS